MWHLPSPNQPPDLGDRAVVCRMIRTGSRVKKVFSFLTWYFGSKEFCMASLRTTGP